MPELTAGAGISVTKNAALNEVVVSVNGGAGATNFNIYANTTDALADTVDGDYFWIVSGTTLELYLNDGGSAVDQDIQVGASASESGITQSTADARYVRLSNEATAEQVRAGTADKYLEADKLLASAAIQTLTDGATITWDMSLGYNAKVTLGGNRTLAVSNPVEGMTYSLGVNQDATGSRTMTWPASFNWGTTGAPTLTTTASKRDRITLFCTDAATPSFDAFLSGKGF